MASYVNSSFERMAKTAPSKSTTQPNTATAACSRALYSMLDAICMQFSSCAPSSTATYRAQGRLCVLHVGLMVQYKRENICNLLAANLKDGSLQRNQNCREADDGSKKDHGAPISTTVKENQGKTLRTTAQQHMVYRQSLVKPATRTCTAM